MTDQLRKFRVVRIYVVKALNKEDALYLVHVQGGNYLEYETAKPYEERKNFTTKSFMKTLLKQIRGR